MNTNLEPYQAPATPAPYDPEFARLAAQRETIKAQIMPENSTEAELDVFMATCAAQGLDPFMGQIIAIRPDSKMKDGKPTGPVKPFRTWEGLVAIADRTGEYQGRVGPLWTGDGKEWLEVWLDETNPPKAAKVGIWRKGFREPVWGIATLAAWGMQDEYVDETDRNGNKVVRHGKFGDYTPRVKTGKRSLKPGWWQMPQTPHQLAKIAFVIGLKSSFQPQMLRRATQAIDAEVVDGALPASRDQIVRLHAATPASLQGRDNRSDRLQVAGMILRRPVTSYNDLTSDEVSQLADYFEEVGEDYEEILDVEVVDESTPALTRGQAAPISPGAPSAAGADRSAGQATPVGSHVAASEGGMGAAKAAGASPAPNSTTQAPAEHHTAEARLGEVAPADGTVPEGSAGVIPDSPPGAAPISPIGQNAPKRKRYKTDPTGAPNVAGAMKEAQQFRDDRKTQTEVEHPPTNWLQALPPEAVYNLMTFFQNADNPEAVSESVVRVFARRNTIEHGTEWTPEQIDKLGAETWRKK